MKDKWNKFKQDLYESTNRGIFTRCTPWGWWCIVDNIVFVSRHLPIWGGARGFVRKYDKVGKMHAYLNDWSFSRRYPDLEDE